MAQSISHPDNPHPPRQSPPLVSKLVRRLVRTTTHVILGAGPATTEPAVPTGFEFFHLTGDSRESVHKAKAAMAAAHEPDVVEERLQQGHEFFGWEQDGCVYSFGWSCSRDRVIGTRTARTQPGRVFLYNFHTLPSHRGLGLYPSLLQRIRWVLGRGGAEEFIIDVATHNIASMQGVRKGGFRPIDALRVCTIAGKYRFPLNSDGPGDPDSSAATLW